MSAVGIKQSVSITSTMLQFVNFTILLTFVRINRPKNRFVSLASRAWLLLAQLLLSQLETFLFGVADPHRLRPTNCMVSGRVRGHKEHVLRALTTHSLPHTSNNVNTTPDFVVAEKTTLTDAAYYEKFSNGFK